MKSLLPFIFLILLMFASSCGITHFQPVQRDSTVVRYVDSLRIRDSVVLVNIPTESSSQIVFTSDTSHLETSIAVSDAWTDESGRIHHTLNNKSREKLPAIVPIYDRARMLDERQVVTITKNVEVEKELTWWQKFRLRAFWYLLGLVALWVVWKIVKLRLHL